MTDVDDVDGDWDTVPKAKEPPIMEYLCNLRDRIDSKELKVKTDRIHDLIVNPAREGAHLFSLLLLIFIII